MKIEIKKLPPDVADYVTGRPSYYGGLTLKGCHSFAGEQGEYILYLMKLIQDHNENINIKS